MRRAGILMAVSSLPSKYGIGCFSKEACEFVDCLVNAGQSIWQILPLGPTSYGDSPYQSFSTFAINPYFIDPETLISYGWITEEDCNEYDWGKKSDRVDYAAVYAARFKLLKKAFTAAKKKNDSKVTKAFLSFKNENEFWLPDYALFMALKDAHDGKAWSEWEEELKVRKEGALKEAFKKYADEVEFYEFLQFEAAREWKAVKDYANEKGISIVGDIPIYVAFDSSDAWAAPELFQFKDMEPVAVAGCPPDAFTADGQLWGNPLYNWPYHKETDYAWWMKRLGHSFEIYDIVRIDHFRGFDAYYSIPYPAENARKGKWVKGPGYDLFKTMKERLGDHPVIAEDLGFLTASVKRLVKKTGYPGMKVLQFAFNAGEDSDYLPHNFNPNTVVYTGTHDNDTTLSWYEGLKAADKKMADKYLGIPKDEKKAEIPWYMIKAAYASVSELAVIPMQDVLSLGGAARMNFPSTLGGNWEWRMKSGAFTKAKQRKLRDLAETYWRK